MPRYFFHTADGSRDRDRDGTELPDLDAARKEAIRFIGAILCDDPEKVWDGGEFRVEVTDQADMALFSVITLTIDSAATWADHDGPPVGQ